MPNVIMVRNDYPDELALENVLNYVLRSPICGGYGIDPDMAFEQMRFVKQSYYKSSGVQLKHFIISFTNHEMMNLDFNDLLNIGFQVGKYFREYQMIYSVHIDTAHTHMHFVMNTVSFLDGHKYAGGLLPFRRLCSHLAEQFPRSRVFLCQTSHYSMDAPYTSDECGEFQIL